MLFAPQQAEAQHHQRDVDDPHERAHIPTGKQGGENDRQAGGAAEGELVRALEQHDAQCRQNEPQIQKAEETGVLQQCLAVELWFLCSTVRLLFLCA